jgi:acylphosphatase
VADPSRPDPADRSEPLVRARVRVSGRVQGVAFRAFTQQAALRRGLTGSVRNLHDGRVEVEAEGGRSDLEGLLAQLRVGPPGARVLDLEVQWEPAVRRETDFIIRY